MWYYCSLTDLFTDGGEQEVIVYVCVHAMNPRQFPFGDGNAYLIHSFEINILANLAIVSF